MFNNIRDKFYSVVKDGVGTKIFTKHDYPTSNSDVNFNAGAKILEKYQKEWEQMHCLSEQNAHAADSLATEINNMHFKLQKDYNNFVEINHLLNGTPPILQNIHNCVERLTDLKKLFESVELSLINLEDIIEIGELQEKQLEHRFQLALYKEKKLANLELKRVDLAAKHAQSLKQHEIVQQQKLHERQEIFNEAFQNDLKVYKEDGTVPTKSSKNSAEITQKLKDLYEENLKRTKHMEIIFVSKDEDERTMMDFFQNTQGPWLALPHGDNATDELIIMYGVTNTPSIVVVNYDGDVITKDGRREILEIGVNVLTTWDE